MGKVRVSCEIDTYNDTARPSVRIHNHALHKNLVEIEVEGKRYAVDGYELKIAVDNCMNVGLH